MNTDDAARSVWRAKNAARIRRAMRLIQPTHGERGECMEKLEGAIIELEFAASQETARNLGKTKLVKKAAAQLATALRRLEAVARGSGQSFLLMLLCNQILGEVGTWRAKAEALANVRSSNLPRYKAQAKRRAVREAYSLLKGRGEIDFQRLIKLAALLYGDESANLRSQCRAFLRSH